MTELTHARLLEALDYSIVSGRFYWRIAIPAKKIKPGDRAGYIGGNGYAYLGFARKCYCLHRLAWFHVTGEWPPHDVDHVNGAPLHNQFINLRAVTHQVNLQNKRRPNSNSSTGFLGVHKNKKRFGAKIVVDGVQIHLGTYDTPEEAHQAHLDAKRQAHEGCTL